jgi:hypothetical protein
MRITAKAKNLQAIAQLLACGASAEFTWTTDFNLFSKGRK